MKDDDENETPEGADHVKEDATPPARAASRSARRTIQIGLAMSVAAVFVCGVRGAGSVFVGSIVGALNVYVLTRSIGATLGREAGRWARLWALVAPVKLLLFLGLVAALLVGHFVQPLPFLVGYAALPLGLTLEMLRRR